MSDFARFHQINSILSSGDEGAVRDALRGLQARFIAMNDEIDRLRFRVSTFESMLSVSACVEQEKGFAWLATDSGRQGPFCPHCHGAGAGLIPLEPDCGMLACPSCGSSFPKEGLPEPGSRSIAFSGNAAARRPVRAKSTGNCSEGGAPAGCGAASCIPFRE